MQKSQEVGTVLGEMQEAWKLLRGTQISDKQTNEQKETIKVCTSKGRHFSDNSSARWLGLGMCGRIALNFSRLLTGKFLRLYYMHCSLCNYYTSTINNVHKSAVCHVHKALNKCPLKEGNHTAWKSTNLEREREKEAILSIYTPLLVLWHISSGSTRGDMRVNAYGTCLERYLNKHRCALTATWNLNAFQAWNPSGGKSINSQHHYISKKAFTHHQERVILGLGGIRHPALVLLYNNFPDKEWGKFTDSNESGCKL